MSEDIKPFRIDIPQAALDDLHRRRSAGLAERNNNVVRWTEFDRGGRFGATEEPDLIVADLREALRPYRPKP